MSNTSYPFKENSNVMNVQGGEKKVMKKILTVALSTAMAFSMFASVAFGDTAVTPQQKFDALAAKGIFNGYPDGSAHLEKEMTRAEFAKVITKLLGLKEVTGTLSYKDKGYDAKNWAVPYIEAVTAAGIMQGQDSVKKIFNYNGKVTIQEMATVLTRALKLEIPANPSNNAADWAKGYVQAAIDKGLISKDANFKANASRSQLVEAAYAIDQAANITFTYKVVDPSNVEFTLSTGEVVKVKLDTPLVANKETEVKFKDAAGNEYTAKVTYVVTTATKVDKVSASNLKEIEVAFDGTVDSTTAERTDNYSVSAGSIKSAVLEEDGKTVRLTLADGVVFTNNKEYKLTVNNVKAGDKVISTTDFKFTPVDNALPEVTSVTALGNKAIKVVVSEPVKNVKASNFTLDGVTFYGSVAVGGNDREIILKPYASNTIAVGEHKLTSSLLEDYNSLKSLSKEVTFSVVEDKEGPTVTEAKATLETVTLTFNEDIDPDTVKASDVYWLSGTTKKYADSYTKIAGNKYSFTFKTADRLPNYETTLYVDSVSDYSGNVNTTKEVKITPEIDQTRPEIIDVKVNSDKKNITVKFNKAVTVDKAKFVITDKDGKVISIRTASVDSTGKVATVELYNTLSEDNVYTFKASGIQDTTALHNTLIDYSTTISLGDKTGPTLTQADVSANSATRTVVLNFNEKVDPATALSHGSYYINFKSVDRQLPDDVTITPTLDGKGVILVFPEKIDNSTVSFTTGSLSTLKVLGVKDLAGNVMQGFSVNIDLVSATARADVAAYSSTVSKPAAFTDENVIKVKFNQPIDSVNADAFALSNGTKISDATADGTNVVTLTLSNKVGTSISGTLSIVNGDLIKTVTGNSAVLTKSGIQIDDQVAPYVKDVANLPTTTNAGKVVIQVPFSETLGGNASDYAKDLTVTKLSANGNDGLLLADQDYTTSLDATDKSILLVTLNPSVTSGVTSAYSVKVKDSGSYIKDVNGNVAKGSSTYETAEKTVSAAPKIVTASDINNANKSTYAVNGTAPVGSSVTVTITDAATTPVTQTVNPTVDASGNFTATLDASTLADGKVTVSVVSTDAAGYVSAPVTKVVNKDVVAPVVATAKFIDATHVSVKFSEAVNAKLADFTNFKFSVDGVAPATPGNISEISGSGTDTIVLTVIAPGATDASTGTVDIGTGVKDLTGNAFAGATAEAIAAK